MCAIFILGTVCYCQAQLRPVSMLFPDCLTVVEVWLVCCGFTEAKPLAMKMKTFFKLINEQVTEIPCLTKQALYYQAFDCLNAKPVSTGLVSYNRTVELSLVHTVLTVELSLVHTVLTVEFSLVYTVRLITIR